MPLPQVYERLRTAFLDSDRIWIVQFSPFLITPVGFQVMRWNWIRQRREWP
jgi:hypothetical protein